jgi:outer membrane protein TolC
MLMTRLPAPVAVCSLGVLLGALSLLGGCSAEHYSRNADAAATRILDHEEARVTRERRDNVQIPTLLNEDETSADREEESAAEPVEYEEVRVLSLQDALELAVKGNRDHIRRRESLYLSALSLRGVRHSYAPQVDMSLSYLFSDGAAGESSQGIGVNGGVSQTLPWGGTISFDANTGYDVSGSSNGSYSSSAGISLTQPLLRGAGAAISHESLIQAERELVYSIRDFELAREDFSIEVASSFFSLVRSGRTIGNLQTNLDGFVFYRKQAEALYNVGRASELDVLRARRSELNSTDSLISAQEERLVALDRFRIFLGLPKSQPVDVKPEAPVYIGANYDIEEAIELAFENRLDVITRIQRLEDERRSLAISKDGLRPDLSLTSGFGTSTDASSSFDSQDFHRDAFTAGLNMSLPVDRVSESNAYRRAQISMAQAERSFDEFRDSLELQIRSSFRELERRRQSLEIQDELIFGQEKNVRIAQLRFEQGNGQVDNRDVTEANDQLLEARNRMIDERVNYEISRLQLLKDLGILFIDEKGMFQE